VRDDGDVSNMLHFLKFLILSSELNLRREFSRQLKIQNHPALRDKTPTNPAG
jgi:hypothetical protein